MTRWATRIEGRKAIAVGNEFGVVHQLCLFRRRRDPRARDCCPSDPVDKIQRYLRQRAQVLADSGKENPSTLFIRLDGSALLYA